jgi:hypothetical protein
MSVDSGMGNYAGDADLQAIEDETLPGTSNVKKIIGSLRQRLAQDNPTNTDTNINKTVRVDVNALPKAQDPLESLGLGEGFSTPVDYTLPTRLNSVKKSHDDTHPGPITDGEALEHMISHHTELVDQLARGTGRFREEVIEKLRNGDLRPSSPYLEMHKSLHENNYSDNPRYFNEDTHPWPITNDETVEHIISHHPELVDDLAGRERRPREEIIERMRSGDLKPAGGLQRMHKSHLHENYLGSLDHTHFSDSPSNSHDHSHEELVVNIPDTFNPTASSSVSRFATGTSTETSPMMPGMEQNLSPASITAPDAAAMQTPTTSPSVSTASFNPIAYVIENGEVRCSSCENYYIPKSEAHIKSAHCGAPECHDKRQEEDMKGVEGVYTASKLQEDAEEGDVVRGKMIKTTDEETRLASTDDYLAAFEKTATDSQLYYRGYEDAKSGKPMDEDLAELSDDYFHGYDQFRFYHIPAQSSSPQSLYDIKPNSNNNPRMTQGEVDSGPNELTDGHSFATHASKSSESSWIKKSHEELVVNIPDTFNPTANLKEAFGNPLDFAHSLQETEQLKRQRERDIAMNISLMQPNHQDSEQTNKKLDEINCNVCNGLGHTDYHAMHESIMPQTAPKFNSGEESPQGPKVNPIRPVHQQIRGLLDVGRNIGTEVAKEQAKMAPKELATEIAGGGPEDPLADIAAGGEEAWATVKGVADGLIKSPLKTVQVGKDIKQDAQAVVPKIKKILNASSIFPVDVIQNFFED